MNIHAQYQKLSVAGKLLSPLLLVFLSLWTAGTLGFGYFARNLLEQTARQETEDLANLVAQDLQQKQDLLRLKTRWISENQTVVRAVASGDRALMQQTMLPIQAALELNFIRIVKPQGTVALSLQQGTLLNATPLPDSISRESS
jgi:two-component system, NtrC family, sensor kinase